MTRTEEGHMTQTEEGRMIQTEEGRTIQTEEEVIEAVVPLVPRLLFPL